MYLLKQSGGSLAGRIAYQALTLLDILEPRTGHADRLWTRGGFPDSFPAESGGDSLRWRRDFVRIYLERDIPQLGPGAPAETLRRFL